MQGRAAEQALLQGGGAIAMWGFVVQVQAGWEALGEVCGIGRFAPRAACRSKLQPDSPHPTTRPAGADMEFLRAAFRLSRRSIYSLHKSSTRDYIQRLALKELGAAEVGGGWGGGGWGYRQAGWGSRGGEVGGQPKAGGRLVALGERRLHGWALVPLSLAARQAACPCTYTSRYVT